MTRAYVLDETTRDVLGLVDQSWEKLSYTRRYFGMDTFQMSIQRARLWASTLEEGRLLYLPDEGDRLFVIEQITSLATGSTANDLMTVSGRSLEGIAMVERLVIPDPGQGYDRQTGVPAETAMKHYVIEHAEAGAAAARQVPGLNVVPSGAAGVNVTVAGRYQTVFDIVNQIGLLSGIGWEILYNAATDEFDFDVIVGVDRSASVFFDFEFETLERWEELRSILESKTVAVVAGQGEAEDREIRTRWQGAEPTGFARREAFLDARDIELGQTAELDARGDSFLAAATKTTRLEAGIHQYGSFRYGTHWDMGDLVLIRNMERGISYTARVVEVTKEFAASAAAPTVTAIIDRPFPTMKEQINGAGAAPGKVDYAVLVDPEFDSITLSRTNPDIRLSRAAAGRLLMAGDGGAHEQTINLEATAGQRSAINLRVAGDTQNRLHMSGDGTLVGFELGAGGATARDVNLYRAAADVLRSDDAIRSRRAAATDEAFGTHETASTTLRLAILADGKHLWGPTSGAADIELYRLQANTLATAAGDSLWVGGALTTAGQEGILLNAAGAIEIINNGSTPFIDFKDDATEDFDARIIYNSSPGYLEVLGSDFKIGSGLHLHLGGRAMSGAAPIRRVYTAGATWTKPANFSHIEVEVQGGGGGGGGTAATGAGEAAAGGTGGGGGYARKLFTAADLAGAASFTVAVGGGGSAGTAGANAGGTGGTSSFSGTGITTVSGAGGTGGAGGTNSTGNATGGGGGGGVGSGGDFNIQGGDGGSGRVLSGILAHPALAGNAYFATAGRVGFTGAGATGNLYGGGGLAATAAASTAARAGGVGGQGIVIVTEYYFS